MSVPDQRLSLNTPAKIIAGIQILGSALGAVLVVTMFPGFSAGPITAFLFLLMLGIAIFTLVFGLMLVSGRRAGLTGSLIAHALQVPSIMISAGAYQMAFGIGLFVGVTNGELSINFSFGSQTVLLLLAELPDVLLAVNLYALFALHILLRIDRNPAPSVDDADI